jgi:hypothetical protein
MIARERMTLARKTEKRKGETMAKKTKNEIVADVCL